MVSRRGNATCIPSRYDSRSIMLVDCCNNNNQCDLPRCNVARVNKSKPEMTRCGVASIFRWFRPLRVESSSFPLLLRTVATMAHVRTHTRTTRAHLYSICNSKRTLLKLRFPLAGGSPFVHSLATFNFSRLPRYDTGWCTTGISIIIDSTCRDLRRKIS